MSRFNSYARKVDEIAKAAFEAYRKAEKDYKDAEAKAKQTPQRRGWAEAEYAAKAARAHADFLEKQKEYIVAKRAFANSITQFAPIRRELAAAIDDAYSVDPAQLDADTLELLKSGIMTGSEYKKLLDQAKAANNPTMVRMIGKYAGDAAAERGEKYGQNDPDARTLRLVEHDSRTFTGGDHLAAFDAMVSVYHRCTNNPAMIDHWDELNSAVVESF